MVTDSFFLSSIIVPKFVTELTEKVNLYSENWKKSKCKRWYRFNKTQGKIPFKPKKDIQKIILILTY